MMSNHILHIKLNMSILFHLLKLHVHFHQVYYRRITSATASQTSEEREYVGTVRDVQLNQSLAVVLTDSKATLHPIECMSVHVVCSVICYISTPFYYYSTLPSSIQFLFRTPTPSPFAPHKHTRTYSYTQTRTHVLLRTNTVIITHTFL